MKTKITNLNMFQSVTMLLVLAIMFQPFTSLSQPGIEKGIQIFESKNYYGAEKFFTDYLNQNPNTAMAYYYLGRIAIEKKNNEEASEFFEKAVDIDNGNSEILTWKGINYITLLSQVTFIKQGLYAPRALSALEKAVALDPNNILASIYLAGYYAGAPGFAGGSREKAIGQINTAVEIDSFNIGAQFQRGVIMSTFKEYAEAKKSFEKIMNIDPEYYPAFYQLGKMSSEGGVYLEQGQLSLIRFIKYAPKEFDENKDDAWWYLGNIYVKSGNNEEARKAYRSAVTLSPDNEEYQKALKSIL